jgi:hypothetical protein
VLSLEALRQKLQRQQFTAFELKLRDWRKGIVQAYRYRYFCDRSIVVLPRDVADRASKRLELFASLDVGLWSFDPDTDVIAKYFTPYQGTARNLEARNKGDREKSGAESAAKLILVYDVPLQNPVTMASLHGHRN